MSAESPAEPAKSPSHIYIDEKWDATIDTTLRRVVYGTMAGGLAALTLFRAWRDHRFRDRDVFVVIILTLFLR